MYRMVKASTDTTLSSKQVHKMMGQSKYEQLYKQACMLVDDEITNQYGDVDVKYDPGDCTAKQKDDGATITSQIYAKFKTEEGKSKDCYAEVVSEWDGNKIISNKVSHFSDEVEYE